MKRKIALLVARLLLTGATTATAQFTSTPLEPGLHDYLIGRNVVGVELTSPTTMNIAGVYAEWISARQVTLTTEVMAPGVLDRVPLSTVERRIAEFNVNAPVGTLSVVAGKSIRLTHHLNPAYLSTAQMARAIAVVRATANEIRRTFGEAMAANTEPTDSKLATVRVIRER